MTSAFGWIGDIVGWFGQFIPKWKVVDTRYGAIKWTTVRLRDLARFRWEPSAKVTVLGPGFHVYWDLFSTFEVYPIKRQTAPLAAQVITTADNKSIVAAGVLVYEILDLGKILAETWDPEDTVRDIASASLHEVLAHRAWDDIRAQAGKKLDTALRAAARDDLSGYGVRPLEFRLNALAQTKVYRMLQSTSVEGEMK